LDFLYESKAKIIKNRKGEQNEKPHLLASEWKTAANQQQQAGTGVHDIHSGGQLWGQRDPETYQREGD
jgi:hypothetical protein